MGTGKKEATRRERQGKVGDGMGNVRVKGENFYRSAIPLNLVICSSADLVKRCEEGGEAEYVQGW